MKITDEEKQEVNRVLTEAEMELHSILERHVERRKIANTWIEDEDETAKALQDIGMEIGNLKL